MQGAPEESPVVNQCPDCGQGLDVGSFSPYAKIECPHCGSAVRVRTRMGQYEITGVLGEGGMSQVFRAVDTHLQREAALKILHQELSRDAALTAMFEREAKLTASILHPNVVKVYTVGKDQGYFFIAMELVDATSLEQIISSKEELAESEVWRIAHDVTRGLQAAAGDGLIHRDIKPGNILVTKDGTAKLVDFGLAIQQGGQEEDEELWATPFYVPPEKLDGLPDNVVGDIYSLGATLYHALAGRPPFEANTSSMEDLKEIKKQTVDLRAVAPGVSKASARLVQSLMSYRPEDRPPDYGVILERIEALERREFGTARGSTRARIPRRRRTAMLVSAGAVLLVALGWMVSAWFTGESEEADLDIGTGERIVHAGTASEAERFLVARQSLVAGEHGAASAEFDALAEGGLSPVNRMWCRYLSGLARLFLGEVDSAREAFAAVAEIEVPEDANSDAVLRFLRVSARELADPLPYREDESEIEAGSYQGLSDLGAGLKNWHLGQFESAQALLRRFGEGEVSSGADWIEGLRGQVAPYLADAPHLLALPNPSRRAESDLDAERAALEEALGRLRTKGAAPRFVRSRLDRIEQIKRLAEAERLAAAPSPAGETPPAMEVPPQPDAAAAESDAVTTMLREQVEELRAFGEDLRFAEAADQLRGIDPGSEEVRSRLESLVALYEAAGELVPQLARTLAATPFEGEVRRREGIPVEGVVRATSVSVLTVDLGFGPNELAVSALAPEWLAEAAAAVFEPPATDSAEDWWHLAAFALATGEVERADEIAALIAGVEPEFAGKWEDLRKFF